jgi:transposase
VARPPPRLLSSTGDLFYSHSGQGEGVCGWCTKFRRVYPLPAILGNLVSGIQASRKLERHLVPLTKPIVVYAAAMPKPLVTDEFWDVVKPLLPKEPPRPRGGRPRISNRATFTGILFVLKSGIPWQMLPQEMGCGSGMTCWRRLREWQAAGVWEMASHDALEPPTAWIKTIEP